MRERRQLGQLVRPAVEDRDVEAALGKACDDVRPGRAGAADDERGAAAAAQLAPTP
jgi:hypothetical protein